MSKKCPKCEGDMKTEYSNLFGEIYHCKNCDNAFTKNGFVEVFPDYKKCPECKHKMHLEPNKEFKYIYRCGWCNDVFYVNGGRIYPRNQYGVKIMGSNYFRSGLMLILRVIIAIIFIIYLIYAIFLAHSINYWILGILIALFIVFYMMEKVFSQ